jgi:hypothetical protein
MKKYEISTYEVENEEIIGTIQEEIKVPEILVESVQQSLNDVASEKLILGPALIIPDKSGIVYVMIEYNDDKKITGKYNITITKSK